MIGMYFLNYMEKMDTSPGRIWCSNIQNNNHDIIKRSTSTPRILYEIKSRTGFLEKQCAVL